MRSTTKRVLADLALASLTVCLAAMPTLAQEPPTNLETLNRSTDRLPPLEVGEPAAPRFELPPLPERRKRAGGKEAGAIVLRQVHIEGNEAIDDATLQAEAVPFIGRNVSVSELLDLRDNLTRRYVEKGYVSSGAVLQPPPYPGGSVTYRIVEGSLPDYDIVNLQALDRSFIEDRLDQDGAAPLNVNELRERVELLLSDPAIERLQAALSPGRRPGTSRLRLEVEEAAPYQLRFGIANDQSPSVGAERLSGLLVIGSLTGLSDPFDVELGISEGVRSVALSHSRPILPDDTRVFGSASLSFADVVEEPFSEIDVESESRSLTFGVSKPIYRTLEDEVRLDAAFDHKRSKTFLLGDPFSFSQGVDNGRSVVNVLRLSQQWNHSQRAYALALRSTENIGFDFIDSTRNRSGVPDGQFVSWLGQAQYAATLFSDWRLVLRGDVQLSTDGLLPLERIAIGGANTVRGYRENQLVVDSGWAASAEMRIPVSTQSLLDKDVIPGDLHLVSFLDGGGGWNLDTPDPTDQDLLSIGGGFRWRPIRGLQLALDVGVPLKELENAPDDDLQDWGIHFRVSTSVDGGFPSVDSE